MRLSQIRDLLACDVLAGEQRLDLEVEECFAAELMSDVLAHAKPGVLLVTGLTGIQSVHTADLAELLGIVYVNGQRPAEHVLDLAREKGIPIQSTDLPFLTACGILSAHGLLGGTRSK